MKAFDIVGSIDKLSAAALERLSLVPADSVLVVVRSGILSRILPVGVNKPPVTINQDMRAFVPHAGIDARFIAWQLLLRGSEVLSECAKDGTTVASIDGARLGRFEMAVAPEAQQKRIVLRIEELATDLDAAIGELQAAQIKLARYRQSLLKAAVEGDLTAEWRQQNPPQETGAELLERILRERGARRAEPLDENAGAVPEGWTTARIGELATVGTGVTPLRSNPNFFAGGDVPWITSGALNAERVSVPTEYVTRQALRECRLQIYPAGALLIAMYGEGKTRGKCAELTIDATINQAIAALVFEGTALQCRDYVKAFLWNSYELMRQQASGGVQPNLNLQIIKRLAVPFPPLDEQVAILSAMVAQLDGLRSQQNAIDHGLKMAAAQRQNILRTAFSGQLVPQDPADEPAGVLLDRIRAAGNDRSARIKPTRSKPAVVSR